jgi:hypothetical protein
MFRALQTLCVQYSASSFDFRSFIFFQEAAELFVKDKKAYERRVRRIAEESLASS